MQKQIKCIFIYNAVVIAFLLLGVFGPSFIGAIPLGEGSGTHGNKTSLYQRLIKFQQYGIYLGPMKLQASLGMAVSQRVLFHLVDGLLR